MVKFLNMAGLATDIPSAEQTRSVMMMGTQS
jgi:hypothetical protein